jgi:hypothetical protein
LFGAIPFFFIGGLLLVGGLVVAIKGRREPPFLGIE